MTDCPPYHRATSPPLQRPPPQGPRAPVVPLNASFLGPEKDAFRLQTLNGRAGTATQTDQTTHADALGTLLLKNHSHPLLASF
jgi:hypothetical protein